MAHRVLEGVVVKVVSLNATDYDATVTLTSRLAALGASVKSKYVKGLTHVCFDANDNTSQTSAALAEVYERLRKAGASNDVRVVSPLWLQKSEALNRKAKEAGFLMPRPGVADVLQPAMKPASAKRKRRRSALPAAADDFTLDLGNMLFSSTQQMQASPTSPLQQPRTRCSKSLVNNKKGSSIRASRPSRACTKSGARQAGPNADNLGGAQEGSRPRKRSRTAPAAVTADSEDALASPPQHDGEVGIMTQIAMDALLDMADEGAAHRSTRSKKASRAQRSSAAAARPLNVRVTRSAAKFDAAETGPGNQAQDTLVWGSKGERSRPSTPVHGDDSDTGAPNGATAMQHCTVRRTRQQSDRALATKSAVRFNTNPYSSPRDSPRTQAAEPASRYAASSDEEDDSDDSADGDIFSSLAPPQGSPGQRHRDRPKRCHISWRQLKRRISVPMPVLHDVSLSGSQHAIAGARPAPGVQQTVVGPAHDANDPAIAVPSVRQISSHTTTATSERTSSPACVSQLSFLRASDAARNAAEALLSGRWTETRPWDPPTIINMRRAGTLASIGPSSLSRFPATRNDAAGSPWSSRPEGHGTMAAPELPHMRLTRSRSAPKAFGTDNPSALCSAAGVPGDAAPSMAPVAASGIATRRQRGMQPGLEAPGDVPYSLLPPAPAHLEPQEFCLSDLDDDPVAASPPEKENSSSQVPLDADARRRACSLKHPQRSRLSEHTLHPAARCLSSSGALAGTSFRTRSRATRCDADALAAVGSTTHGLCDLQGGLRRTNGMPLAVVLPGNNSRLEAHGSTRAQGQTLRDLVGAADDVPVALQQAGAVSTRAHRAKASRVTRAAPPPEAHPENGKRSRSADLAPRSKRAKSEDHSPARAAARPRPKTRWARPTDGESASDSDFVADSPVFGAQPIERRNLRGAQERVDAQPSKPSNAKARGNRGVLSSGDNAMHAPAANKTSRKAEPRAQVLTRASRAQNPRDTQDKLHKRSLQLTDVGLMLDGTWEGSVATDELPEAFRGNGRGMHHGRRVLAANTARNIRATAAAEHEQDASSSDADEPSSEQGRARDREQGVSAGRRSGMATRNAGPPRREDGVGTKVKRQRDVRPAKAGSEQGPLSIACTSVDTSVAKLCKTAAARGLNRRDVTFLDSEADVADGQVTHLVMGQDRRTIKALLAACSGAQIVSPDWVLRSVEAGRWLDAAAFPADVANLQRTSQKAREWNQGVTEAPLATYKLCFAAHTDPDSINRVEALKSVLKKLGATVAAARSSNVCVVCQAGDRRVGASKRRNCPLPPMPRGLAAEVPVVNDEWLLSTAEHGELQSMTAFAVKR